MKECVRNVQNRAADSFAQERIIERNEPLIATPKEGIVAIGR